MKIPYTNCAFNEKREKMSERTLSILPPRKSIIGDNEVLASAKKKYSRKHHFIMRDFQACGKLDGKNVFLTPNIRIIILSQFLWEYHD